MDTSACYGRQDFILQVDPSGCSPSVVTSNLLENQPTTVFCPILATQLNPLISVNAIKTITMVPNNISNNILTVGYQPAQAALGQYNPTLNTPYLGGIGYATIVLKQQPNESLMPDFVQGNMTAKMTYNVQNAFGVGNAVYYLPQITDTEFQQDINSYSFWNGKGFLKLDGVNNNQATISVYSGLSNTASTSGSKIKIASLPLTPGQTSSEIYLPGFNFCMGGLNVKLQDLENPDTTSTIIVDADVLQLKAGETFLDGKCTVNTITKYGVNQNVKISCSTDNGGNSFILGINPKINLNINGVKNDYSVGDKLPFDYTDEQDVQYSAYLGFVGNSGKVNAQSDSYIRVVLIPKSVSNEAKLSTDEISYVAGFDKAKAGTDVSTGSLAGSIINSGNGILATMSQAIRAFITGKELSYLKYSTSPVNFLGQSIQIMGYAGAYDLDLSQLSPGAQLNYTNAMSDYNTIIQNYGGENTTSGVVQTYGQAALDAEIKLAASFQQLKTATQLCQQYAQNYGVSTEPICTDPALLANTQTAEQSVSINGETHIISFDGIQEPSYDEYGIKISVKYPDDPSCSSYGCVNTSEILKDGVLYVNQTSGEFIQLTDISQTSATFTTNLIAPGSGASKILQITTTAPQQTLKIGTTNNFGGRYGFTIQNINLQQVAKVSVTSDINYAQSNATFNFKIGIEKNGIQLTPQQTEDRIKSVNSTLKTLSGIQSVLNTTVIVGKTACLATEAGLLLKNFVFGSETAARQQVMNAPKVGWNDKCTAISGVGKQYPNVDACLENNSAAVDASVNAYNSALTSYNNNIQTISQSLPKTNVLGENVANPNSLNTQLITNQNFQNTLSSELNSAQISQVKVGTQEVKVSDILQRINNQTASLSQTEDLQLNAQLLSSGDPTVQAVAQANINQTLGAIWANSNLNAQQVAASAQYGIPFVVGSNEKLIDISPTISKFSQITGVSSASIPGDTNVAGYRDSVSGNNYLLVLNSANTITQTYLIGNDGKLSIYNGPTSPNSPQTTVQANPLKLNILTSNSYNNKYLNPEVQYFETGQYAGLPAIVPFDLTHGWYAAIQSNLPVVGGLTSYQSSGRVSSFFICNVGPNGKEENMGGDDTCGQFIPGSNQPPTFSGAISTAQAQALESQAITAITDASKQHKAGVSQVTINHQTIPVGRPAAGTPAIECEDFMSPSDCNILFNVCDPVVCPSSRCNLGGAYPVQDVIQSGVIGSLALCLPNYPQVKVPICISGLNAGLQGYMSVLQSYQQCLQTSLTTGQTVGICDEINSIYTCQFFWKQLLPLVQYGLPKILGQGSKGGGEYLAGSSTIANAQQSINYFSQYYAANSYKAFQERSTQSVGDQLCDNFISATVPGGNLFNTLVAPDSPSQFYGQFDETSYTTATNPPTSQYQVYYHIYAGTDTPAYYQVYLEGSSSSFYQDTSRNWPIASGEIATGSSADNTTTFTAPSGYQQLCIVVNGQEQCGFKQTTTDFGINSLTQQYAAQQASQTDITTEAACVSGTPSAYSLLNLNAQAGVTNTLNPAIYNEGIIRICSTNNPGQGTDPNYNTASARWQQVGYCDNQNLRCWLDTQSVKNVIQNQNIQNATLQSVSSQYLQTLQSSGTYLDPAGFSAVLSEMDSIKGQDSQIITSTTGNLSLVSLNNQKAELYYRRGNAYSNLAVQSFNAFSTNNQLSCVSCLQEMKQWCLDSSTSTSGQCVTIGSCTISPTAAGYLGETTDQAQSVCSAISNGINTPTAASSSSIETTVTIGGISSATALIPATAPLFELNGIYYNFSNGNWYWSPNQASVALDQWYQGSDGISILTQKNQQLITTLANTENSYSGGIQALMHGTTQNSMGDLTTKNVVFSSNGIFTIHGTNTYTGIPSLLQVSINSVTSVLGINSLIPPTTSNIEFQYVPSQSKWQWSLGTANEWSFVPLTTVQTSGTYNGQIAKGIAAAIINSLGSSNADDINGAMIIFNTDSPDYVLPSSTSSSTSTGGSSATGNTIISCSAQTDFDSGECQTELQDRTGTSITCSSLSDCQLKLSERILGEEIIKLVPQTEQDNPNVDFSNATVKADTGANSFECLALQLAMTENAMLQCGQYSGRVFSNFEQNGNSSYCQGNPDQVLANTNDESSFGIMQINTAAKTNLDGTTTYGHCGENGLPSDATQCRTQLSNLDTNINFGLNLLMDNYDVKGDTYDCYLQKDGNFVSVYYSGWKAALRSYNGWNSECTDSNGKTIGNPTYVDAVVSEKSTVGTLFPQCA